LIAGVRTRRDFPAFVARRPRARSAVIVDLAGGELGDILSEVFHYPIIYDLDAVKGRFDTIILIRRGEGYVVEFLGPDLGPRASSLKIRGILYRHV
jgi:ribosomal biogenesis protein, containing Brix domain